MSHFITILQVPSESGGESSSGAGGGGTVGGNASALGVKIMKNLAGGGKDRERPLEKVEKRLTEVRKRLHCQPNCYSVCVCVCVCIPSIAIIII